MKAKLEQVLEPEFLEVIDESGQHNVPPGSESHFKVVVVSRHFERKALIERHQEINRILEYRPGGKIHALSMQTFTPNEWLARNRTSRQTPPCLGGGKR